MLHFGQIYTEMFKISFSFTFVYLNYQCHFWIYLGFILKTLMCTFILAPIPLLSCKDLLQFKSISTFEKHLFLLCICTFFSEHMNLFLALFLFTGKPE